MRLAIGVGALAGAVFAVALLVPFQPDNPRPPYGMERAVFAFHGPDGVARQFRNVTAHDDSTGDWHRLRHLRVRGEHRYALIAEPGPYTILGDGDTLLATRVHRGRNSAPRNVPADSAWYKGRK